MLISKISLIEEMVIELVLVEWIDSTDFSLDPNLDGFQSDVKQIEILSSEDFIDNRVNILFRKIVTFKDRMVGDEDFVFRVVSHRTEVLLRHQIVVLELSITLVKEFVH